MRHKTNDKCVTIQNTKYVLYGLPNAEKLSQIFMAIKGNKKFADLVEKTQVNITTLSRISKGKIVDPLSIDLIKKLADISDNKEMIVDALMRANGYLPELECRDIEVNKQKTDPSKIISVKKQMEMIIKTAYVDRGFLASNTDQPPTIKSVISNVPIYDFCLPIIHCDERLEWVFYLIPYLREDSDVDYKDIADKIMRDFSSVLLTDAWSPKNYVNVKFTLCMIDNEIYNTIDAYLNDAKLNNRFSICLINLDDQTVKEKSFSTSAGKKNESLFDLPIILESNEKIFDDNNIASFFKYN